MTAAMYIIVQFALISMDILSIAMLARAVLSWFPAGNQSRLGAFLYMVTEPIILPIRLLCNRFGWFQGLPLDMPFFLSMILLTFLSMLLQIAFL